jgi:plastocyanin
MFSFEFTERSAICSRLRLTLMSTLLFAGILPGWHSAFAETQQHTVVIDQMQFSPQVLEVNLGDMVVWQNRGDAPHTATAENRRFFSGTIPPGESQPYKAAIKGNFPYFCSIHPQMKGMLVVR